MTTCSVIVCTRNRCRQLAGLLESIAAMAVPYGLDWELLVVDNGSDDDTPATVAGFAGRLPVTRIWEPEPGVSNARNTGVRYARGDLIVWTDDDTLVVPGWLAAFADAFAAHPDAALFAGRVTPVLLPPTPDWFREAADDLHYLLAARDFGPVAVPLAIAGERLPFGASAAVRAIEQRQFLYDPDLGVAPGRRRGGEETAVYTAILAAGHSGWWVPGAEVKHQIIAERQTTEYIDYFYAAMGEAWARGAVESRSASRAPLATRAKIAAGSVRLALAQLAGHSSRTRYRSSLAFHKGALRTFNERQK